MNWREYIEDPAIFGGNPTIKGTLISVKSILEELANGLSVDQILASYPDLTRQAVQACLHYAMDRG